MTYPFFGRLLIFLRLLLVSTSSAVQLWLFGLAWVAGLSSRKPRAIDTLSAVVGHYAIDGRVWALAAEAVIDWLAERFGSRPWHCRYEAAQLGLADD